MSKSINIAYLMHGLKNVGGGERSIYYIIKNINKKKYKPIILYSYKNDIIEKLIAENIPAIKVQINHEIASLYRDEIRFKPFKLLKYLFFIISAAKNVKKVVINNNIMIIHPHDNLSKIIGFLAARSSAIKTVAHCRDLLNNSIIERLLLYFQTLFFDIIITVSEANRNLFKFFNRVPSKVIKIYNGIDLKKMNIDRIKSTDNMIDKYKYDLVVGIIGVFDELKGHLFLFEAIKNLIKNNKINIVCLVVGEGRESQKLHSWVNNNNLNNNIIFTGFRDDIPACLKLIDVLVIPSKQESFPRVVLEAMSMSVPVIGSNVGGIPEAVIDTETGFIVPPKDPIAIQHAIEKFLKNPKLIKEMGIVARRRCEEKFDIKINIKKTEKIYRNIIRT